VYIPTVIDPIHKTIAPEGSPKDVTPHIHEKRPIDEDTPDLLSRLDYRGVDLAVLWFDVSNNQSLVNLSEIWIDEVRAYTGEMVSKKKKTSYKTQETNQHLEFAQS
jgi:hypothetical protein